MNDQVPTPAHAFFSGATLADIDPISGVRAVELRTRSLIRVEAALLAALLCVPVGAQAATTPITVQVAQSGGFAGIRNTVNTTWLPAGEAFTGLSGRIAMTGTYPAFSEALVIVGSTPGDQAACAGMDRRVVRTFPTINRFWAGILKANDTAQVDIPVSVSLRRPMAPASPGAGTCMMTLVSAGYPFLHRGAPLYTTTDVQLRVSTTRLAGDVLAFGMGGEFKFDTGAPGQATYVGIRAERPLHIDGIATSISAAPVAGAPPQSGWGPDLRGPWRVLTDFVVVPAPACAAAHYEGHRANATYSVLRLGKPAPLSPPPGSLTVARAPLEAGGSAAVQRAEYVDLTEAGRPVSLSAGDCLIVFESIAAHEPGGRLDVENQSTVYLAGNAPGRQ